VARNEKVGSEEEEKIIMVKISSYAKQYRLTERSLSEATAKVV
jgi:hypothetical protein